jgi:hypothetical protein
VWLGLLWSAWHLPVIDYLGVATPHGEYWLPFFLAFALAMTAMRVFDSVDLREHGKLTVGAVDARQFDGFAGGAGRIAREGRAGSGLVRSVRRRAVDGGCDHCLQGKSSSLGTKHGRNFLTVHALSPVYGCLGI